ncbi:hypothetical protein OB920_19620 [Halobacteria archaeon HArc-gm2]|nr:hypothetical protein [Halomicrobium zhouii]MCU4802578.1 hypothetical protein [Halobacteria archaeon HArc-gm2]
MQAGVIGVVDGSFNVVDSFSETVEEGGQELRRALDVERVFSLPSGDTAFAGRAAREYRRERESARIADDGVSVVAEPQTATRHTQFVGVPGEFVVAGSSKGTFAFDLIGQDTNTSIGRGELDLDAFFERHGDAAPWKAGFSGTEADGVSGVLHGTDLRESHDLEDLLAGSSLNQLGLTYTDDGDEVKVTAARSGYVELYRPRDLSAEEYLAYLQREIIPHLS